MKKPPENGGYSLKYNKIILLKDGRECCLRNGTENDAQEVLDVFNLTHAETDYLLTYPDETVLPLNRRRVPQGKNREQQRDRNHCGR